MPSAITALFGADARPFEKEVARAEGIALGFSQRVPKQFESSFAASFARLKGQMSLFDNFKMTVDKVRGHGFMSADESASKSEMGRQIEVEEATRANRARRLWRQRAAEQIAATKAASEAELAIDIETATRANRARYLLRMRAEERANRDAAQMEMISGIARNGGLQSGIFGGHGIGNPGGGSFSGIIRESLVIVREGLRGNWTRMTGSVTLLAQYMGVLGTVIKSTAADSIKYAMAMNVEAASAARATLAEKAKAKATYDSAIASGLDEEQSLQLAMADNLVAAAAQRAAVAQAEKAQAAVAAAEEESAAATLSLGPIGWVIAALVAVGVAAFFVWRHYKNLATEHRNLASLMNGSAMEFKDQAGAIEKAADAAREFSKWLTDLSTKQQTMAEKCNLATKAIEDQFDAQKKQADADKENALAGVDLDEASGKITHEEAIKKRGAIEKKSIEDNANLELKRLNAVADRQAEWSKRARDQAAVAVNEAKIAEIKANEDPESKKRSEKTAADKRKLSTLGDLVDKAEENVKAKGIGEKDVQHLKIDGKKYAMSLSRAKELFGQAEADVQDDQNNQTPYQTALETAKKKATSLTSSADEIDKSAGDTISKINSLSKNNPALIKTQEDTIDKKMAQELAKNGAKGGFSLNSQQRIGAYASTPPDWSVLLLNVKGIHENTKHLQPNPNAPPGSRPPQFGPRAHK